MTPSSTNITYMVLRKATPNQKKEVFHVLNIAFHPYENVSIACNISKNPRAAAEINELCGRTLEDGISVAAIDNESKKIIGVACNKIQVRPIPGTKSFFEEYLENECKENESIALIKLMIDCENMINPFEILNVDKILDHTFLAVLPEYRKNKVGFNLTKLTLQLLEELGTQADGPKAVTAMFSSNYSQRIGELLGFELLLWINYVCFSYDKIIYSDKVNSGHKGMQLVAKKYIPKSE